MYILIKTSLCPELKKQIWEMIDVGEINTWKFIKEDGKRRLEHTSSLGHYDKVVLRFINTYIDGVSYIKIMPTTKVGETDHDAAEKQKGVVLGRFAELLNTHFSEIGSYETVLRDLYSYEISEIFGVKTSGN